ncbi:MAG: pentapeptide repeat-containing protein [Nitrospirota bacterium]
MAEKKKTIAELIETYKTIITIFLPLIAALITANYQVGEYMRKSSDENFRSIVKLLSSENKEERLAAASNMGTFIKKGSYWPYVFTKSGNENTENAVDILINRVSVELDYNVLNAIIGSLEKTEKAYAKKHKEIVDDLLALNRNIFIQDYALKKWKEDAEKLVGSTESPGEIEAELVKRESLFKKGNFEVDRVMLDGLKEKMKLAWNDYYKRDKNYSELDMHKQAVTDIISVFLSRKEEEDKEKKERKPLKLNFYQNSLNTAVIADLNLSNSDIKRSAFSLSMIQNTIFNEATILDTIFTFSDLTKSSFKNCKIGSSLFDQAILKDVNFYGSEFKDVFFAGSDLTEADFRGVEGLKPEYFYEAEIDKAIFDEKFDKVATKNLKENDFIRFINKSELTEEKKDAIFSALCELKYPKDVLKRTKKIDSCKKDFKKKAQEISK